MMHKSAFFRSVLTVFLTGFLSVPAFSRETIAKLHVPWPLFESELQTVLVQDGTPWRATLPDTTLAVAGWNWNLSGVRVDAQVLTDSPVVDGSKLFVRASKLSMRLAVDRVSIDQVVEQEIAGAKVRVHLKASCGPLRLIQEQAQAEAALALNWDQGSPAARLQNLGLAWSPGSWAISEFSCEGPQGFGDVLHTELVNRTKEPTEIKPLLADWLARELQARLQESLQKMKSPIDLSTGDGKIAMRLGAMTPASTGLVSDIILGEAVKGEAPVSAGPVSEDTLSRLPKDAPAFVGHNDALEHIIQSELTSRGDVITVDLLTFSSFKNLLQSRFLQFFVWPDLFNYEKTSPFFVRLRTPSDLKFSVSEDHLSTTLPVQAIMQSKRDGKWWDYLTMQGKTQADIQIAIADGVMKFETSLRDPEIDIAFGKAYKKTYSPNSWIPTSSIRGAFEGPQSSLSGSKTWPDVDLGPAGRFRSHELGWLDPQTFVITWQKVQP